MSDDLEDLAAAAVAAVGVELVELDRRSGRSHVVVATVDRPGGADLDAIAEATRALSALFDRHDPFPGHRYTLEVSSPGVERPLRTPAQFERAVGERVSVRTAADTPGGRRLTGTLVVADADGIELEGDDLPGGRQRLAYASIDRARTVFEWGSAPRPGRARAARGGSQPKGTAPARGRVTTTP